VKFFMAVEFMCEKKKYALIQDLSLIVNGDIFLNVTIFPRFF